MLYEMNCTALYEMNCSVRNLLWESSQLIGGLGETRPTVQKKKQVQKPVRGKTRPVPGRGPDLVFSWTGTGAGLLPWRAKG